MTASRPGGGGLGNCACGSGVDDDVSLGSFRLKVPLGEPAEGLLSGYVRQPMPGLGWWPPTDAPLLVSSETWRYTREADADGVPLRRCVHARGLGDAVQTDETHACPDDDAVPPELRGLAVSTTDADGVTTATTRERGTGDAESQTFAPDATGGFTRETIHRIHGLVLEEELVYDSNRNVTNILHTARSMPNTSMSLDAFGNVTNAADTAGNSWQFSYTANSILTNFEKILFFYLPEGEIKSIIGGNFSGPQGPNFMKVR